MNKYVDVEYPKILLAGPGSGKTTRIIDEVVRLNNLNVRIDRVLILTFSRKAVQELINRIETQTENKIGLNVFTFHSFCLEIIKNNIDDFGLSPNYQILDENNAMILLFENSRFGLRKCQIYIDTILKSKDLGIGIEDYKDYLGLITNYLRDFGNNIDDIKNNFIHERSRYFSEDNVDEERKRFRELKDVFKDLIDYSDLIEAWELYEKYKKEKNLIDYPDMNIYALECLEYDDSIIEDYDYIIVDEFQDTNELQYSLLKRLTMYNDKIMVVGDINQSIYGFRGSKREVIEAFLNDFKTLKADKLDISYRCSQNILDIAKDLILKNYSGDGDSEDKLLVDLKSNNTQNEKVKIIGFLDKYSEANYVVNEIKKLKDGGVDDEEIMVLYRSHGYGNEIKSVMREHKIKFTSVDTDNLLMKTEIKIIMVYLAILNSTIENNIFNSQGWWRIFHKNFDLSMADSRILGDYLRLNRTKQSGLFELILRSDLEKLKLSDDAIKKIKIVIEKLKNLRKSIDDSLLDLIYNIIEITGVASYNTDLDAQDNFKKKMNIKYFIEFVENYVKIFNGELNDFMKYLDYFYQGDFKFSIDVGSQNNGIKVLTMHASKGLEAKYLFLIGWGKNFPMTMKGKQEIVPEMFDSEYLTWGGYENKDDIYEMVKNNSYINLKKNQKEFRNMLEDKEERRLGYVAITRAKLFLTISHFAAPSYYLEEMFERDSLSEKIEVSLHENNAMDEYVIQSDDEDNIASLKSKLYDNINQGYYDEGIRILENLKQFKVKKVVENKKYMPLDFKLSFTSLKNYKRCAKMFELQYILKLPTRSSFIENDGFKIGNMVHKILEDKFKLNKEIWELYDEYVETDDEISNEIKRSIKIYLENWEARKYDEKLFFEAEKEFNIILNNHLVTGKIDRIDKYEDNYSIIDYKTGVKEVTAKDRRMQLSIYAEACKQLYGVYPEKLILDELGFEPKSFVVDKQSGVAKNEHYSRTRKFNVYDEIRLVEGIIDSINTDLKEGFELTEDINNCRMCSYKLYCERWDM